MSLIISEENATEFKILDGDSGEIVAFIFGSENVWLAEINEAILGNFVSIDDAMTSILAQHKNNLQNELEGLETTLCGLIKHQWRHFHASTPVDKVEYWIGNLEYRLSSTAMTQTSKEA